MAMRKAGGRVSGPEGDSTNATNGGWQHGPEGDSSRGQIEFSERYGGGGGLGRIEKTLRQKKGDRKYESKNNY
jgi:hypothetical protein